MRARVYYDASKVEIFLTLKINPVGRNIHNINTIFEAQVDILRIH